MPLPAVKVAILLLLSVLTFLWARPCVALERTYHTATFDSLGGRIIVIGGWDIRRKPTSECRYLELFVQDDVWHPLKVEGPQPPPRSWHSAVFDDRNRRIIVFGGFGATAPLNDVWVLNLEPRPRWEALEVEGEVPSPRSKAAATYDPDRQRMIVHGGYATGEVNRETWVLDLANRPRWSRVQSTGPAPECVGGAFCFYDRAYRATLMMCSGQVWLLGGDSSLVWTPVDSSHLPERLKALDPASTAAALDPVTGCVMIFGGGQDCDGTNDLWELCVPRVAGAESYVAEAKLIRTRPADWPEDDPDREANLDRVAPEPRVLSAAVFDTKRRNLMIVSGGKMPGNRNCAWAASRPIDDLWAINLTRSRRWDRLTVSDEVILASARPKPQEAHQRFDRLYAEAIAPGASNVAIGSGSFCTRMVRGPLTVELAGWNASEWLFAYMEESNIPPLDFLRAPGRVSAASSRLAGMHYGNVDCKDAIQLSALSALHDSLVMYMDARPTPMSQQADASLLHRQLRSVHAKYVGAIDRWKRATFRTGLAAVTVRASDYDFDRRAMVIRLSTVPSGALDIALQGMGAGGLGPSNKIGCRCNTEATPLTWDPRLDTLAVPMAIEDAEALVKLTTSSPAYLECIYRVSDLSLCPVSFPYAGNLREGGGMQAIVPRLTLVAWRVTLANLVFEKLIGAPVVPARPTAAGPKRSKSSPSIPQVRRR